MTRIGPTPPAVLAHDALPTLNIGVTGHRDLVAAEIPVLRAAVRALLQRLAESYPGLEIRIISALAEGSDLLVAETALDLGLAVIAPLPAPLDTYAGSFSSEAERERLRATASRVDCRVLDHGMQDEALGYASVGVFISSHCQILLALWDGMPSAAVGGTAQVVEFHLRGEMAGLGHEISPNLLADDDSDLVYHLKCTRQRTGHASNVEGMQPGDARWLTNAGSSPGHAPPPFVYRRLFGFLAGFAHDLERYPQEGMYGLLPGDGGPAVAAADPTARRLDAAFRAADSLAGRYQRRVHASLRATHGLAVLMGLAFMSHTELDAPVWTIAAFLALFAFGYMVYGLARRGQWHRKYLDYRGLAEGLRVQFYWHVAGVRSSDHVPFAYDSFMQKQDLEIGWIRHAMRGYALSSASAAPQDPDSLRWVIGCWVGGDEAGRGQLDYYRSRVIQREANFARTRRMNRLALFAGLSLAALFLALGDELPDGLTPYLLLATGMFTLTAGIAEAYSHKKADKELIKQYRFMHRLFQRARERLVAAANEDSQRLTLRGLGVASLEEHAEWILMHRQRPLDPSRIG
jgi:hypothetical protein